VAITPASVSEASPPIRHSAQRASNVVISRVPLDTDIFRTILSSGNCMVAGLAVSWHCRQMSYLRRS